MEHVLHHLLTSSTARSPHRTAVEDGDRSLSYAELDARSDQLASLLLELGVSRGDRVGLYLEKSLEAIVGIYAILKVGCAYVPLDPSAPAERCAYIVGDCGLRVLVSSIDKVDDIDHLLTHGAPLQTVIVSDADEMRSRLQSSHVLIRTSRDIDRQSSPSRADKAISHDLAYILYTSGSTGTPKGVMLSHQNALAFVRWAVETFAVSADDRLSNHAPLQFDLSVFDLYAAAMTGATVVLVPPELSVFPVRIRDFIERKGITIWYSVPSILSMLALRGGLKGGELRSVRTVLFAGEVFPARHLRSLMSRLPHVRFANLYGPTETNVCTWYDVPPLPKDATAPIPIGQAIDDVEVFAITDGGAAVNVGDVGELYVRGPTVMQGYWGDYAKTARGLVRDPRRGELRDLAYRTGDLARLRPDGDYELLGRRDHQIKSRGYRIELGEVEAALHAHPDVRECAAIAVPDPLITNRIVAFVAACDGLTEETLIGVCGARVPRYMLPERIEFREALPKTSTGKIDRQALARLA